MRFLPYWIALPTRLGVRLVLFFPPGAYVFLLYELICGKMRWSYGAYWASA